MSDEIVKYSNQFNNQALRKFTALDLDLLMAIASRVRDKGTDEVAISKSTTPIVSAKMETPAEALLTSPLRSGGHA